MRCRSITAHSERLSTFILNSSAPREQNLPHGIFSTYLGAKRASVDSTIIRNCRGSIVLHTWLLSSESCLHDTKATSQEDDFRNFGSKERDDQASAFEPRGSTLSWGRRPPRIFTRRFCCGSSRENLHLRSEVRAESKVETCP